MRTVPNPAPPVAKPVHFPSFTEYSCGETLGRPQSDDPAKVTCDICLTEYAWRTDPRYAGGDR